MHGIDQSERDYFDEVTRFLVVIGIQGYTDFTTGTVT
eukprot:CAMPEP_0194440768 /NCGR_PEP_ID=MMETSP0176-20130528/117769_1 /TAXON_ID=216777 /ORGANISM="Proboscia alata, Strain PI-D3" /LENGTH=36 /DNA_ID= /DNA_START= /DNA_END= /DNA_ORIENTATION=